MKWKHYNGVLTHCHLNALISAVDKFTPQQHNHFTEYSKDGRLYITEIAKRKLTSISAIKQQAVVMASRGDAL